MICMNKSRCRNIGTASIETSFPAHHSLSIFKINSVLQEAGAASQPTCSTARALCRRRSPPARQLPRKLPRKLPCSRPRPMTPANCHSSAGAPRSTQSARTLNCNTLTQPAYLHFLALNAGPGWRAAIVIPSIVAKDDVLFGSGKPATEYERGSLYLQHVCRRTLPPSGRK